MTKPETMSMFATIKFNGMLHVPDAEIGEEFTIVMKGTAKRRIEDLKDGEVITGFVVKADRCMKLDIDPNELLSAANEKLISGVVEFLSDSELDALAQEADTKVEIDG